MFGPSLQTVRFYDNGFFLRDIYDKINVGNMY